MAAFFGQTPESLLPRSDSRNPATTCKGITKSGRPCRRDIASRNNGVLAVVSVASDSDSDEDETGAAAFFCWQHKDQAEQLAAANAAAPKGHDTQLYPLKEQNSIDTLVARLGVLEVNEPAQPPQEKRRKRRPEDRTSGSRPPRRVNRPPTWGDHVQGPLMSVPSDLMAERKRLNPRPAARPSRQKKSGFWDMCCVGNADDDDVEVVRHKRKSQHQANPTTSQYVSEPFPQVPPRVHQEPTVRPYGSSHAQAPSVRPVSSVPGRKPLGEKSARPLNKGSRVVSETTVLLSYIPKTLTPQLTSQLLAELSKPISPHDDEGYIYIFWLTPESSGPAPSSTASTLLVPPSRPEHGRQTSDVLRQYSVKGPRPRRSSAVPRPEDSNADSSEKNTILLKIGRANNVHRRMNEWTRQCGYSLSLVRFYPYVSTTPSPSPNASPQASPGQSRRQSYQNRPMDPVRRVSEGVRKVPHAMRVERLIHIELGSQRVMKKCEACGKDHREWFEVDASREGVKAIDEVVKRWVSWAERANN
jgi:hypothetical protein